MLRRRPFFRDSSTPSTHRTTQLTHPAHKNYSVEKANPEHGQVKTDPQGTTQLILFFTAGDIRWLNFFDIQLV